MAAWNDAPPVRETPPAKKNDPAATPQDWSLFFRTRQPSVDTIRELVLDLTKSRQHEQVVALLEQAILNGKTESWMYPVLAVNMELIGRPKSQIERVLLSTSDLVNADPQSQLFLAAYLTRLGRYEQALQLCRQASRGIPDRPEPYAKACELASRHQQYEAALWAAPGVLQTAWVPERSQLIAIAEQLVVEADADFRKRQRPDLVVRLQAAMEQARRCDLQVRMEWHGDANIDLLVDEPLKTRCSSSNPRTTSGGMLVRETLGGKASDPNQAGKPHVEEYACPVAASGEYQIRIRHQWGNVTGKRVQLTLTRHAGAPRVEELKFSVAVGKDDQIVVANLQGGRREAPSRPLSLRLEPIDGRPTGTILQQIQAGGGGVAAQVAGGGGLNVGGQRPFGTGVGYQPVISLLNEGVTMSAMAVISGDRRYVRITATPAFTSITDVFTFSFQQ